jgi:hypothetical protein
MWCDRRSVLPLVAKPGWYQAWYHSVVAMTLRLTDEQTEALRRQAEREGVSMQVVAQRAITEYVAGRDLAADVDDALDRQGPRYQTLLDRLGSV